MVPVELLSDGQGVLRSPSILSRGRPLFPVLFSLDRDDLRRYDDVANCDSAVGSTAGDADEQRHSGIEHAYSVLSIGSIADCAPARPLHRIPTASTPTSVETRATLKRNAGGAPLRNRALRAAKRLDKWFILLRKRGDEQHV